MWLGRHRGRIEGIQLGQGDFILPVGPPAQVDVRQPAHAEDLARPHVLQEVAHHEIRRGLHVSGLRQPHLRRLLDQQPRVRLDREADDVEMRVALEARLLQRLVNGELREGAVLRAEDESHWPLVAIGHDGLGRQRECSGGRPDVAQGDRLPAADVEHR